MRLFVIVCCLFATVLGVGAQSKHKQVSSADNQQISHRAPSDSVGRMADSGINQPSIHKKILLNAETLTTSDYMMSIERVNDMLNAIRDSAKLGFDVVGMGRRINDITIDVNLLRLNVRNKQTVVNMKNLYLYQSFASSLDEENGRIKTHVAKMYNRVYNAKLRLNTALSDSVFRILYADSNLRNTFNKKLSRLERKWDRTDSITKANIDTLNAMKIKVADNSISLSGILNIVENRLDKAGMQLFGPETNYLWQNTISESFENDSQQATTILNSEQKAIGYYFSETSTQRLFVFIFGVLLFIWLFAKRKLLKTIKQQSSAFEFLHLQYLNHLPILSLLVVLLSLMPFFDAYAPTTYIAIEYVLLLAASSVIFLKKGNLSLRLNWLILVGLLIVDVLTYLLIKPSFASRMWLLIIHAGIIVFTFRFYKGLDKQRPYYKLIKIAAFVGMVLPGAAILFNLFGRVSLSGLFGMAGIFAITQAVVLTVFVDTIIEIILIQLQSSRMKKGIDKPFDSSFIVKKIKTPMVIIAIILWAIILTSNLNIYHSISNGVVNMLTSTRSIGSISFKLISVLWFFVIIWLAHILQRLISFLFGETGLDTEDSSPVSKGQHSRLLITRLLVLVGGYLLAIAASGLPIDKLTFLLGALGVGIGMGLQNVVNNFVSGIILIFDGSLQIGDEIEVSGQAGKVKEIGLRASTLNTADGAEVIIPNGNILSQNIVNWTYSNDQKRVMIWFSLSGEEMDSNVINNIINSTLKNIPNVISQKKPVILYTRVTPQSCAITVRFWSTISNVDQVKSEAMLQLSTAFAANNIDFE
jgi:small-conductance mechanosensitive channel